MSFFRLANPSSYAYDLSLYEYKFLLKNIVDQLDRQLYSSYYRPERLEESILGNSIPQSQDVTLSLEDRMSYASRIDFFRRKYADVEEKIRDRCDQNLHIS